jgi:hypothetical protein
MKAKKYLSQKSQRSGRDSNPVPSEYRSEALTLGSACSGYLSFTFLHIMIEVRIYKFRKNLQKEKENNVGIGLYRKICSFLYSTDWVIILSIWGMISEVMVKLLPYKETKYFGHRARRSRSAGEVRMHTAFNYWWSVTEDPTAFFPKLFKMAADSLYNWRCSEYALL